MRNSRKILTAAVAAATLVGGLATATESFAASRRGGHYDRHRDNTGSAVVAGIAGLALGAALAGNSRGYYGGGSYYAPPAYSYYGYAPGYYAYRPQYNYHRTCWRWVRDRWGRSVRVSSWC